MDANMQGIKKRCVEPCKHAPPVMQLVLSIGMSIGIVHHIGMLSAGKCQSGRFTILDKPLMPFSAAAAACARAGKSLATIDKIFGGSSTSSSPLWIVIRCDSLTFDMKSCIKNYAPLAHITAQCYQVLPSFVMGLVMLNTMLVQTHHSPPLPRLPSSSAWARITR